jgi:hypothetical protein
MMKKIKFWFKRKFQTFTESEAVNMGLVFLYNISRYDEPEICFDSIWIDNFGKQYRIKNK